jgi:putative transposase
MNLEPYSTLNWAYQLHYYLCFQTHHRRNQELGFLADSLTEICAGHNYHLLRFKFYPNQIRCLLSVQPNDVIATVLQTLKSNLSRVGCLRLQLAPPFWARGYLARSIGSVSIQAVKDYLGKQAEHHEYARRKRPPCFRYRNENPVTLQAAHAGFELSHHVVVSTRYRKGIFDSQSGEALCKYWMKVAAKHGFAIDEISGLPDHVHLLVRTIPKMSIAQCVLSLLKNGQYFIAKNIPAAMIECGIDQLWQPSAYVGTCGRVTTALLKAYMGEEVRDPLKGESY